MPGKFYAGNKLVTTSAPMYLFLPELRWRTTSTCTRILEYYDENYDEQLHKLGQHSMANRRGRAMRPHQL